MVRIIRPDGSSRDVTVAGHFREEHLCSLVDDELCHLQSGETLTLHLFHPDGELAESLRNRWQEGLSDNRQVFVREVLGPNDDPREIAYATAPRSSADGVGREGEPGHSFAAGGRGRSRRTAQVARDQPRFDEALLSVWVHGDEQQQRAILGQLADAGMVRLQDYEEFVSQHRERRWKGPWIDFELKHLVEETQEASGKKQTVRRGRLALD